MSNQAELKDMTRHELESLIREIIRDELRHPQPYQQGDSNQDIMPLLLQGFIRQKNVPAPCQMLREDRDR